MTLTYYSVWQETMKAIVYQNTKTTLPNWVKTLHQDQPRGVAYDAGTHFVHYYGSDSGFYVLSVGLTVTEKKNGTLEDWAIRTFGASNIKKAIHPIGTMIQGVWRPGLYPFDGTLQGLGNSKYDQRSSEQALRLLVERLDELLLYIEPDTNGLNAYSHRTRELLILACTEVENSWKHYMHIAGAEPFNKNYFTTKDYVKLLFPLYLAEFEVVMKPYSLVAPLIPFMGWDAENPTKSLNWYDAYNETKHDRTKHFGKATLQHCLSAVAANLVLYCVRFGPFSLLEGRGTLSPLINQLFNIRLVGFNPESSYIPTLQLPPDMQNDLVCVGRRDLVKQFAVTSLKL